MWGLDHILDQSIFFSFDKSGWIRHQKAFDSNDLKVNLRDKICLVTGANSGLGFQTAQQLSKLGAQVILACRNRERGQEALEKIPGKARLEVLDVSDLKSIQLFASRFKEVRLDRLIHNAGVLPSTRQETPQGHELTFATHLLGPFLLTRLLLPKLLAAESSRVIFVSSGGMYTQKLDLSKLQSLQSPFDGVTAYAQAKRAQVILTELWAKNFASRKIAFHSMHPGWVNTPGVRKALPRFWRLMKNRLRSPSAGADTIVWLAACKKVENETGQFWFDRKHASPHLFPWTRETEKDQNQLWKLCENLAGPFSV